MGYLFVRSGILLVHDIRPKLLFQYGVYKEKLYFSGRFQTPFSSFNNKRRDAEDRKVVQ